MLKVTAVVDKEGTALDRLAKGVAKYNDNLDYSVVAAHPKRPSPEQLKEFETLAKDADIIDFYYWRTALLLLEKYPWLKDKKKILQHHNPYSITENDWKQFDRVIVNNKSIEADFKEKLGYDPVYIPLTIDTNFWEFNYDWKPNNSVIMVANRIEGKKGILPVAQACDELNLNLILVGSVSDGNYMHEIAQCGNIEFYNNISDEELKKLYYRSTIHICNSVDNFESGTLPILEAMLIGVPVLTRNIGHVPDLYNGENMVIHDGDPEDVKGIMDKLEDMMNDKKKLEELRQKGWDTAKARSNERRAYEIQRIYRGLISQDPPVSIIVPVNDNPDIIRKCLEAITEQDYSNIELVVADDSRGKNYGLVKEFAKFVSFPVRYLDTATRPDKDYGLARARNEAAIEATGDILIFCDQRIIMEPNAISEFVNNLVPGSWIYGSKGAKKDWVENWSAVYRQEFIKLGGFSERIKWYGGMSQYMRAICKLNGMKLDYIESAKATPAGKSGSKYRRKDEVIKSKNRLFKMGI